MRAGSAVAWAMGATTTWLWAKPENKPDLKTRIVMADCCVLEAAFPRGCAAGQKPVNKMIEYRIVGTKFTP